MPSDRDRERLRGTFDRAGALYQRARPEYPDELIDHLVAVSGLHAGDRLLEVGCGTGKATLPLARRGFRLTCVELGAELGAAARRNLSGFPDVEVVHDSFEQWSPPHDVRFDLVLAATAWHWIAPTVRYRKARTALRPGGHLAFWSATHVFPDDGDPFFAEIQDVYDEIGEALPPGTPRPRPGELGEQRAEIEASGLFEVVDVRHFDWETVHDADSYIDLLDTFSGHIAMDAWQRGRLYGEIRRRLSARPDGRLRRHWGAVLHVARRRA
jgi:SAM-dependent methyltransferase